MAARPSWSGTLRISLVTLPVQLYAGAKPTRNIALHQLHEPTGKRVRNMPYVEGVGEIDKSDIVKGYEYQKGKYVVLTPEEVAQVRLPTAKTIDIAEFVDVAEIDPIYYDKPYYIVPQGNAAMEAYQVIRQALKDTGKAAVGEVVLSSKEHLVAIRPYGKGMLMETLRYADEVRLAHQVFEDIETTKIPKDQLELANSLIKKKTATFDAADFSDSYETALHELIERKLKKLPLRQEEDEAPSGNVISLMDALKKSVASKDMGTKDKGKKAAATKSAAPKSAKKATKKSTAKKSAKKKKAA